MLDRLQEDEIHEAFADLTSRLVSSHWNLYVDREKFVAFERGDTYELEVHGLLSPSIFEQFASVTLMAANLRETIMYRYFDKVGCTFGEHGFINNNLLDREHPNGSRLKIKHLCDRKWSKTLRDQIVHKPDGEDDDTVSVGQLYLQLCQDEASADAPVCADQLGRRVGELEEEVRALMARVRGLQNAGKTVIAQREEWKARALAAEQKATDLAAQLASRGETRHDRFDALRRLVARELHPDHCASGDIEKTVRAEFFKKLWPEIERLAEQGAR